MDNSRRIIRQKFSREDDMTTAAISVGDSIWAVLQRCYGERRHAREMLARDARVTPATAENWLRKRCTPQAEQLIQLMSECEELATEINDLVKARRHGNSV